MANERVLLVEDEKLIRWSIRERLKEEGFRIFEAETGAEAFRFLEEEDADLLVLDYRLPDTTGLKILERVRVEMPEISVVMMTAYGTVENAVQAMKLGAFDYLTKPVNLDELSVVVEKALETTRLRREVRRLRSEQRETHGETKLLGRSPAMRSIMELVQKVRASQATTVLLEGESGTGKNVVAKSIHYGSPREDHPFITITCSALAETLLESELFGHERGAFTDAKGQKKGLMEAADGGTVFLDEIGEMGPAMQAKLLRVLEEKTFKRVGGTRDISVDVRVIAATNRVLEDKVKDGSFREDLFYRLQVIPIHLPPLRERVEDIPLLAQFFLDGFSREFRKSTTSISSAAMELLISYPWPGNIRELRNVLERIMILEETEQIDVSHLPLSIRQISRDAPASVAGAGSGGLQVPLGTMTLEEIERQAISMALEKSNQNQVQAARLLGISRDTLRYRMKKFGLAEAANQR
jgi:DNA-binding NtrC family response regulator